MCREREAYGRTGTFAEKHVHPPSILKNFLISLILRETRVDIRRQRWVSAPLVTDFAYESQFVSANHIAEGFRYVPER